ncbi:putative regulator of G-protein signaling protein [Gautieria morchelliformis]|nr:putative regulator of G-protein signaling protein [Gautieria morchelliformis]
MPQVVQPNASTSHMMKTTKRGRPFLKDTLDLFATLIVSLELTMHKQFFRSFPNSFTTDEAAANLASLKFSQSNRGPDPREPSRIVTTTTTTTFSMTREMAKAMAQHFMDARLIENAADRTSNLFKDRGVYMLTPKGLHVLERFISKNGMSADHLLKVFASQPICLKLLHLERRTGDDEIIISQSVITALFRRFVGRQPNYPAEVSGPQEPGIEYHERSKGIPLMDVHERATALIGKGQLQVFKNCFTAVSALEWLCDFTSIVGRDEAAEMAAHFVRFGLIAIVSDKRKGTDSAVIFTVRGTTGGNAAAAEQGEFRCTAKAIYRVTDEGRRVARWEQSVSARLAGRDSPNASSANVNTTERTSGEGASEEGVANEVSYGPGNGTAHPTTISQATDSKIHRRISMAEKLKTDFQAGQTPKGPKESNTDRLRYILDEPALRSLFREFLRGNFCEENLSFWLEVQDFKRKFNITSSAIAAGSSSIGRPNSGKGTPGQAAMEKHHEALIQMAFVIYNTYLAPSSQCELNIDHGLRNELVAYLNEVMTDLTGKAFQGRVELEQANAVNATQLQTMIRLYERIQTHVFRLMATDSVPKFIKTPRFMALRNWVEEYEAVETDGAMSVVMQQQPAVPPGLDEADEIGRTYMTVSQQANEKAHLPNTRPDKSNGVA